MTVNRTVPTSYCYNHHIVFREPRDLNKYEFWGLCVCVCVCVLSGVWRQYNLTFVSHVWGGNDVITFELEAAATTTTTTTTDNQLPVRCPRGCKMKRETSAGIQQGAVDVEL